MDIAWLCERFHCLPSQLENEDYALLERIQKIDSMYDLFNRATHHMFEFVETATEGELVLVKKYLMEPHA